MGARPISIGEEMRSRLTRGHRNHLSATLVVTEPWIVPAGRCTRVPGSAIMSLPPMLNALLPLTTKWTDRMDGSAVAVRCLPGLPGRSRNHRFGSLVRER